MFVGLEVGREKNGEEENVGGKRRKRKDVKAASQDYQMKGRKKKWHIWEETAVR